MLLHLLEMEVLFCEKLRGSGHLDEEDEEHEFLCEELLRRGDLEEMLFAEKLLESENFEELEPRVPEASFFDIFHFSSM